MRRPTLLWYGWAAEVAEEKLKSVLKELEGSIDQRTPTRVSHRRADKLRVRKVHSADLIEIDGQYWPA